MNQSKQFPLRDILTVTTGRLLTRPRGANDNGIGNLYEILNWMTEDNLFTHQLGRAAGECKPWLLRWFPELEQAEKELPLLDTLKERHGISEAVDLWLVFLVEKRGCKREYDVPRIPRDDHTVKDAYDELVEMRGTDEGIELVSVDDKEPRE